MTTGRPRRSARRTALPSSARKAKSGAGWPTVATPAVDTCGSGACAEEPAPDPEPDPLDTTTAAVTPPTTPTTTTIVGDGHVELGPGREVREKRAQLEL